MGSVGLERYQQVVLTTPAVFLEQETSSIIQPHSQTPPQPGVESGNEANATIHMYIANGSLWVCFINSIDCRTKVGD